MQFIFSRRFKKQFSRLPVKIQHAMDERIRIFSQSPHHAILNNHSLTGEYSNCSSINITGNYRVVFQMLDGDVCYLTVVGTHSQLYE